MDTHVVISRIIAAIMSLLDSANLRNRVYTQQQRIEQLELALEDIDRINANNAHAQHLIAGIVARTRQ
jgi:hypothetical protein